MAKWGELWGNPTWYIEYITRDSKPDKDEVKLLLGDELTTRWHWGVNLVREWTIQKPSKQEVEYNISTGVAYTVIDSVLSLGVEVKSAWEGAPKDTGGGKEWVNTLKIGPSLQWRPTPPANIMIVPLFGLTSKSETSQLWLIAGWEF
jgi:hypothetical protein